MKLKVFIGIIAIFLLLGCPNDSSTTPDLLIIAEVSPSSVSGYDATVALVVDSTAISGATVSINGTTVPETSTAGAYLVNLSTAAAGDTLSLSITKDGYTATASAIIPPLVVTTSPTDITGGDGAPPVTFANDALFPGDPLTVVWNQLTGADAVDNIEVFVDKQYKVNKTADYSDIFSGDVVTREIPTNTIENYSNTTKFEIRTIRKATFTGDNINSSSEYKLINVLEIGFASGA